LKTSPKPVPELEQLVFNKTPAIFHAGDGDFPYRALDGSQRMVATPWLSQLSGRQCRSQSGLVSAPGCLMVTGVQRRRLWRGAVATIWPNSIRPCENVHLPC
jgi:hypothetical protein